MGLRGPGARRQSTAAPAPKRPRRKPWEKAGLSRVERVLSFVEAMPITKGIRAGKKLRLLPGQRAFIDDVYGRPDSRRVRIAIKSEPRGNGKTGLLAPLILAHLLGPESEQRGEIYAAAVDRTQSAKMFDEIEAIVWAVPDFLDRCNIKRHEKKIEVLSGPGAGSIFQAMSADDRKGHGLAPSLWVFDELARVADRKLLEALITAQGKRKRSLGIIISTQAPDDDHALSQLIDEALSGADPSLLAHVTAAPPDCDPFDPTTLRAVNPALGIFLDEADLLAEQERARRMPAFAASFQNLRLNMRVDANEEARLVTAEIWKRAEATIDREKLKGRPCYCGLDLSGKHDLTAAVLVFPSDDPQPVYEVVPFFWTPQGQLEGRKAVERDRFRLWIEQGHMTATPGATVDYRYVAAELTRMARDYDLQTIAYDAWRVDYLKEDLAKLDASFPVPLGAFGQGIKSMSPAIEWFSELALTGRLRHAGNPVLTAAVANAITVPQDTAGNLKIDKPKSQRRGPVRVDGAVALVMALAVAKTFEGKPRVDVDKFLANMVIA